MKLSVILSLTGLSSALAMPATSNHQEGNVLVARGGYSDAHKSLGFTSTSKSTCSVKTVEATDDSNAQVAKYDDCKKLVEEIPKHGKGIYQLTNGGGGSVKSWVDLYSYDTCHFYINRKGFEDPSVSSYVDVFSEDIMDAITQAMKKNHSVKGGTVGPTGGKM